MVVLQASFPRSSQSEAKSQLDSRHVQYKEEANVVTLQSLFQQ
jgi:hypothetical protein